ncbi:probable serine/threonine-protein kinase nek3 isoform X2 [Frieseomelitta varia]|uniref:probable serine/threonine-protein kinase nek3 isoform X2 n=1 Tax=Frieseomelitta varia TaxID=561572 RepID=UPI001CB688C4|nr:probable serine/threonine-protein kinase nek3 isoform X2 [Frieseomelitta varia]
MIQPFLEEGAWCYWVVSIGALLCFLGLIVACICSCRRNENKNEFLGLAGMVTLNDSDNDGFNGIPMSDTLRVTTQDIVDNGKRSTSANRSLPDIPKDKEKRHEHTNTSVSQDIYEITETIGDQSELYATVRDTGKEQISELDVSEVLHQNPSTQETSDGQYLRFASSPNSDNVEHPYAQVQNVQKTEINKSNRNNIKQAIDVDKPSTSTCQSNGNPVAPPRTRRSSSHNSLLSAESGPCDIQAANAISGGVQANQDLPYMTPPLLMLLPQPPQQQSNSPQQHFSGDSQDSKGYTSISVREPLANIIAQTKTIGRQSQSIRPLTDPHYATVSDDSDEMYAAIDEQDKVYTSGSETYAQIQPTMTEVQGVQNEQTLFSRVPSRSDETYSAPQPPSVDSLRHVAHAHSRQASSSSANSSIINPGSPKPEKRQANSPLPPPPEGTSEVYASIEKKPKNDDRLKPALSSGKSLEDMYAKVMKKKKDVEEQQNDMHLNSQGSLHSDTFVVGAVRKSSLIENNKIASSSHDSMEMQRKESDSDVNNFHLEADVLMKSSSPSSSRTGNGFDSSSFALDHGYEGINNDLLKKHSTGCDSNYEVLCPQQHLTMDTAADHQQTSSSISISLRNNVNLLPITSSSSVSTSSPSTFSSTSSSSASSSYSVPFKHRQISNASSEDPGYEKVRLRNRSEIDTDSEPNYESMPHDAGEPNYASVCRPGDSDTDPNYESVNHGDPNYESVKYMSVTRAEEPPYEQVNAYKPEQDPNGYEKVKKHILFNADYEQIHQNHSTRPINGDTDDEHKR